MALHQYIGARYVPKFYENSLGTSEWVGGVIYEPLTIVTYNGNSYTSKKTVPANIGDPSGNPTYWAATGLYNAQVELLRQQVEAMQDDVDIIRNRRFIFIGDSYQWGWYNGTQITSFLDYAVSILGLTPGDDYYRNEANGSGFAYTIQPNKLFIDMLRELENTVDEPDKITDIITIGSANDIDQTSAAIDTAIQTYIAYCKATYPNAKIHIGAVGGFAFDPARQSDLIHVRNTYRECSKYGAVYMAGIEWVVHNHATEWDRAVDNLHFNATGQQHLGRAFVEYLLRGRVENVVDVFQVVFTSNTALIDSPGGFQYDTRQDNGECIIEPTATQWDITFLSAQNIGPNLLIDFGEVALGLLNASVNSNGGNMLVCGEPCLLDDGTTGFIHFYLDQTDNHLRGRMRVVGSHNCNSLYTVKPTFRAHSDYC